MHDEILSMIENPDFIVRGYGDAIIGVRQLREKHYLNVVYKEITAESGFIITAYKTSRINEGAIIWRKKL